LTDGKPTRESFREYLTVTKEINETIFQKFFKVIEDEKKAIENLNTEEILETLRT